MEITVVVPTFNRNEILSRSLKCLEQQTLDRSKYEVVVVNDGSTDDTADLLKNFEQETTMNFRFFSQINSGQAKARNLGISKSKGRIIAFIGDDIFVEKDFLERHLQAHEVYPEENIGVLGFIDWHSELKVNAFMEWLTNGSHVFGRFGGHQFAFEKLKGKSWANKDFFYTSNISLKRSVLEKFKFDEDFKSYGWEDIELGYRLEKNLGFKLFFEPKIKVFHHHLIDESSMKSRMKSIGSAAHIIDRKHPELGKVPNLFKSCVFDVLGSFLVVGVLSLLALVSKRFLYLKYYALSKRYFMQGVRESF